MDFTWDNDDNLTERRHRTADTSTNHATDLVHSWEYTSNFVTSYTNPVGDETTYTRDANGNVTLITYPTVTSPGTQAADKDITYNTSGQVIEITDEEEKVRAYTYFTTGVNKGLLQKIEVDPDGLDLETTFTYESPATAIFNQYVHGNARVKVVVHALREGPSGAGDRSAMGPRTQERTAGSSRSAPGCVHP